MTAVSVIHDRVPIRDGFPSFSEAELSRRQTTLRRVMEQHGVHCVILYATGRFNSDMQYLSNWPGGREGYVLLPLDRSPVLLVQLYNHVPMAERLSRIADTRWAGPDSVATVASCLKEFGLQRGRIGLIGVLSFLQHDRLKRLLPEVEFVDLSRPFRKIRLVRSDEELQFFRVAAELTDRSIERLEQHLRPGLREYELAAIVEGVYLQEGGYAGIHFMASTSMKDPKVFVP
ncbi:MAG: M24 family metallopeptidase, partial [Candidatus Binatia bacterium]